MLLPVVLGVFAWNPGHVLDAQQLGSIAGTVRTAGRDSSSVEGARVSLIGTALVVNTNHIGEFVFAGLAPGSYTVRASAIGYETMQALIELKGEELVQIAFRPERVAVVLPDVEVGQPVRGTPDFLRRRSSGRGRYFSRIDIEKRAPNTLADLIRMVPGLRLQCRGTVCQVHSTRGRHNCMPAYFMDGIPVHHSAIWTTPPQDLEAMEVYSGPAETPPELEQGSSCGAIVLWTRLPPERRPK